MARTICALLVAAACLMENARAQSTAPLPDAPAPVVEATLHNLPSNLLHDQIGIWTSPVHASTGEGVLGLLLIASAAALGSEDAHIMRDHFLNQTRANHANTASTGLTGLLAAAPIIYFGAGHFGHDAEREQTGVMGGEAMVDSLAVNYVFKIASRRERPTVDAARGRFFQPGVGFDSSFASNHSVVAWSSATVIASRTERPLLKIAAYGVATGVSATRVIGRDHFPSDVYVGSFVGWMIGRYVVHHHTRDIYSE